MGKITKRAVDGLSPNGTSPAFLWDDQLPGFAAKALPSGPKRYLVKYRLDGGGRSAGQRWLTLGTHGQITPDQARDLARQALAAVARGLDPQGTKLNHRTAPTLSDAWTRFEEKLLPDRKETTRTEYTRQWTEIILPKFGKAKVETLSRGDIDKLHKSMRHSPYVANRVLALISRLMSLCEAWDWRAQGTNPCKHVERFREEARSRFLSVEEIGRVGAALTKLTGDGTIGSDAANAIELLLLTGARRNEILSAEWAWANLEQGVLNLPDSKTGAKPVFLSSAAVAVLRRQQKVSGKKVYVFPSGRTDGPMVNLRKAWVQVCKEAKLDQVRLHDLRHTAASLAVGQGASLPIVGKLLGHTQAQTTQRYAHVDLDPVLGAANAIGALVNDALRPKVTKCATKSSRSKPAAQKTKRAKGRRSARGEGDIIIIS